MKKTDVSIIIVNYNTISLTKQCIDSVFEKTSGVVFEVILVDNASTDGSKDLFEKDNRIRYIYSEKNLGFGRANNLGYGQAHGEYLFLLNSDTYLVNNAVYMLWKKMNEFCDSEETQNIACAGTMLLDNTGNIIHSYARFPKMWRSLLGSSVYPVLWKLHILKELPNTSNYIKTKREKDWFDVEYITGADLMVRKSIADRYGLFDPDFFMYSEETEMQYRYMKAGFRRVICQKPKIVHLEGMSNRKNSPTRTTIVMKSGLLYYKKTCSPLTYGIYSIVFKSVYSLTYLLTFPFINGSNTEKIRHLGNVITM